PDTTSTKRKDSYLTLIANLKPRTTEILVHLGHDDAELQAVTVNHEPYGSAWRQRDYEVVNSPEFKKALKDNNGTLIHWKDLKKRIQASPHLVGDSQKHGNHAGLSPNGER